MFDVLINAAIMSEAQVVMKPLFIESLEHIVNRLVGEGCQHHTLPLLAELFDNFGDHAGFAGSWWAMDQQIILHLHCPLNGQILLAIKVAARREALFDEARADL